MRILSEGEGGVIQRVTSYMRIAKAFTGLNNRPRANIVPALSAGLLIELILLNSFITTRFYE